jgi:hypothetical protein
VFRIMRVSEHTNTPGVGAGQQHARVSALDAVAVSCKQPLTLLPLLCCTLLLSAAPGVVDAPAGAAWPGGQAAPAPGGPAEGEQQQQHLAHPALVDQTHPAFTAQWCTCSTCCRPAAQCIAKRLAATSYSLHNSTPCA